MLRVRSRNIDAFATGLDRWLDAVEDEVADVANGLTVKLFNHIVEISPQYSGDFAGNWQYSVNTINTTFTPLNLLDQSPLRIPFLQGGKQAITYAKAMNKGRDTNYKLGDTFYISNSAVHDEAYALKIENNEIKFRPGNQGGTIARALATVAPAYYTVGKADVQALRRTKL